MDNFSSQKRSWIMSRVHSVNTSPELFVRSFLFRNGFRFRLHDKLLPGKPDIVLPKYKTIIEIRGCFWHRHIGCKKASMPSSNCDYWMEKFKKNVDRDTKNIKKLEALGWKVIIIWECEAKKKDVLDCLIKCIKQAKCQEKKDV